MASNDDTIGGYRIVKKVFLRQSSFGPVYKAIHNETEKPVAAEEIQLASRLSQIKLQDVKEKFDQLATLDSPFLVNIKGQGEAEDRPDVLWVFEDFCEYNLEKYYMINSPSDSTTVSFMCDVAAGVKYLHNNDIIHRRIQPTNILIYLENPDQPVAKIFGCHYLMNAGDISSNEGTCGGEALYMAPELFTPNSERGKPVDIFALGLTFFAMICFKPGQEGMVPSDNPKSCREIGHEMRQLALYGNMDKANSYNETTVNISDDFPEFKKRICEVIRKMIAYDQNMRICAGQVRKDVKEIGKQVVEAIAQSS